MAAHQAGEGHIPSALSILDLVWVIYDRVMNISGGANDSTANDRFILSKGHGSLALYAVLAEKSYFSVDYLAQFCKYDAVLGGHPDCNKVPGVEASTGSLGHGLPIALGMALGYRIKQSDHRVFCLIGDGEANEGTIWESALLAVEHQLTNLCCIIDYNHSTDRALKLGSLAEKFQSFGWAATEVDGHDHEKIESALRQQSPDKPLVVIANTTKGKGIASMENNPAWHHRAPDAEEMQKMLEELA
jgi:transketolase